MQSVNFNTIVLGYQHHTSPSWFKTISCNEEFVREMYYTEQGFRYALIASKNKKNIRNIHLLNYYLEANGLPKREEQQEEKTMYIITAQGLDYFKFGITKNLKTRVDVYKSVLKNVNVVFQITGDYNYQSEKKCKQFLQNRLGLIRDSEKFNYQSEEQLQQIIQSLHSFLA